MTAFSFSIRPIRPHPSHVKTALFAACSLIASCAGVRDGYPNRNMQPSLNGPAAPAQDNRATYLTLIRQMQQQGAYYASLAHIDAYRQHYGDSAQLRLLQADALRETGQGDAAEPIYRALLGSDQAAAAWHGLGLVAAARDQASQAESALQKATQLDPVNPTYLSDLGYARLSNGQIVLAHEPLAKAAELAPDNTKVLANLALWELLSDNDAQATVIMQHANLPPTSREAVRRLAMQWQARAEQRRTSASPAVPASTAIPAASAIPGAIVGIPGGMLERFGTSSAPSEARP